MAIAFDAHSNIGADTTGTISWTHTPVGTPKGVWVYVLQYLTFGDEVTGVTYGGVAMTETASSPYLVDEAEDYAVYSYFLGGSIPAGAQTVIVSVDGTGSVKRAGAITVTAAADTEVHNTLQHAGVLDATTTLTLGGNSCFVAEAIMSASNTGNISVPTGWTQLHLRDFGTEGGAAHSYNTVGTADVTIGPWGSAISHGIAIAIKEAAAAGITGTGSLSATATTASGTGSIGHTGTSAITVGAATASGAGTVTGTGPVTGTGAAIVGAVTASGAGTLTHTGTGAITTPSSVLTGTGAVVGAVTGSGAMTIGSVTLEGIGTGGWMIIAADDGSWSDAAADSSTWAEQAAFESAWPGQLAAQADTYVANDYVERDYIVADEWTELEQVTTWQSL